MNAALNPETASRFARIALGHVTNEYPHKLDHVMAGPEDVRGPRTLHPIFFGSFDWHSCVHGYWLLMRLERLFPTLLEGDAIRDLADAMLTPENVAGELAYLERPTSAGFERPYGWGWLLALHSELARHGEQGWAEAVEPLARAFAARFNAYLLRLTYPIRVGTHFNTAFALTLALPWAEANDPELAHLIRERAIGWFGGDQDCQAWEPGGDEFLSPALMEARLMRRLLHGGAFDDWFGRFLPRVVSREPWTLFEPAIVSDRSDGKIVHLDGLNLSRAWCWRAIAEGLQDAAARGEAEAAAERHIAASLPHVAGDYMGEHWLATFALLALAGDEG